MVPGVYLGRSNTGDYSLISTGDYLAPIAATFKLKDTKTSIERVENLYVIINNVDIEFVKVSVVGQVTSVRCFLSWDNTNWSSEIASYDSVTAIGKTVVKQCYLKIIVDDFLEYFKLVGENIYRQYKLRLMWV